MSENNMLDLITITLDGTQKSQLMPVSTTSISVTATDAFTVAGNSLSDELTVPATGFVFNAPALGGDTLYFNGASGTIYILPTATGMGNTEGFFYNGSASGSYNPDTGSDLVTETNPWGMVTMEGAETAITGASGNTSSRNMLLNGSVGWQVVISGASTATVLSIEGSNDDSNFGSLSLNCDAPAGVVIANQVATVTGDLTIFLSTEMPVKYVRLKKTSGDGTVSSVFVGKCK